MRILLPFLAYVCLLLASSCASILNRPDTQVTVHTTKPSIVIFDRDTFETRNNKVTLLVPKAKSPLNFTAVADSTEKHITVPPANSAAYLSNALYNYGIGFLVEKNNPKRYTFPSHIYLNSADTTHNYFRHWQDPNKGQLFLHLSLPYVNYFQLTPDQETTKSNIGFLGVSSGLDFYHSSNRYLNLTASAVMDFVAPAPAPLTIDSGDYQTMNSVYGSLSENHKVKRFSFGYGLSYGMNTWRVTFHDNQTPEKSPGYQKKCLSWVGFSCLLSSWQPFSSGSYLPPIFYQVK
ncbi:MAG: hypothetical protein ACO1OQ_13400 [Rufibacter sp.]